jgi:hypothetical protein
MSVKEQARALEHARHARNVAEKETALAVEALAGVYLMVANEIGAECSIEPAAPGVHCWAHGVAVGPCPMAEARVALSVLGRIPQ